MMRLTLALVLLAACARTGESSTSTSTSTSTSAPVETGAGSGAGAPSVATPTCEGLAPEPCVLRQGCFLDQPVAGKLVCRAAKNACERAVRQADLIGSAIQGVTEAASTRAEQTCNTTPGCKTAGGKCSCPCAIFGHCDCACGGGYLRRCMTEAEARALADFPPKP